ncbi:receptor-like protein 12 isoform X1 [Gossypium australe]|uniref:Receptor-like protein 12 isoform X1 n=1 Tax=Gossypium australe TaxID=47621 RepID=A0A5B6UMX3_9ROSI|nr:receptor-like protein 12 isoform X1 [Gossypium australe]
MLRSCLDSERSALLRLKDSFILNQSASYDTLAYPKVSSSKLEGQVGGDCCSWDGIECDDNTGHVIGLDLSSSFLYGSINSNNSLFQLHHLRRLNLSDNDFNRSEIPSAIGNLTRLSRLDLSWSGFTGQIPYEVLQLSNLVILDLSGNLLELRNPSLKSLSERLLNLKHLDLDMVNVSSTIPQSLANLSALTYLSLEACELHGTFPIEVFQLPNLQIVHASFNMFLVGSLPEFHKSSSLVSLRLANTGFSGALPESVGNLLSLSVLDVTKCSFSGKFPTSLANLTQLTYLSLAGNEFSPATLSWLAKLTKLTALNLDSTNSYGEVLSYLKNLTKLTYLRLSHNQFSERIPSWFGNLTGLTSLALGFNEFWGSMPKSIFTLKNLVDLDLYGNHLCGTYKLESFLNLKKLKALQLSNNNFSLLSTTVINVTVPKFTLLTLASCNLSKFPNFLSSQDKLEYLDLGGNKIHGFIPKWIWGLSAQTLQVLDLSENFPTGFDQPTVVPSWTILRELDISNNMLQGSLPNLPASIYQYFVSNNLLKGEISSGICNLTSITVLDLSNNSFSGMLPPYLGNLSESLSVLNLQNNNFSGPTPRACQKGSALRMIDLSQNQLSGRIPRSLANCNMLELLNLGYNQIEDTFPSWLGRLQELKILIPRHNGFHGEIGEPESNEFPQLRILDLSFNKLTGFLPSRHFQRWKAMKVVDLGKLRYLEANISFEVGERSWSSDFSYSMTMTKAGVETKYEKIQDFLVAIDLSSNKFDGCIPKDIQILKVLQFLNLSNNFLSGPIPSSLANLSNLQALDLSRNKLSGEIPQELVQLTFLGYFNVFHNQLIGPIPQGKQFGTFENNSFEGNLGLCGNPLSKKCYPEGLSPPPPSLSKKDDGEDSWLQFGRKAICWDMEVG